MTELLTGVEAPSDAELISRVRGGDLSAYGELFTRHVEAARRLGRQLVRGPDVDDLVSDAFAKTLTILQSGGGPDVAFRAYLLTSVRRLHVDRIRAAQKVQPADDMDAYDAGVPFKDTAVADFESGAAAKAFSSLPERWQLVLWHLEVEGQKPADIAPLLGMSANSVSALAYRAREGLRQAFLTMHLADSPTEQCRWVNEHLGAFVRKGLSRRDTAKVEQHLDGCRRCTAMYLELTEVNSNLAGIIAPLLLGAAAAGYLSSTGGAGATGVTALFGRVRDALGANSGGGAAVGAGGGATTGGLVTAGGIAAASLAAVTAAVLVMGGGSDREVITEADQSVGAVQDAPGNAPLGSLERDGRATDDAPGDDGVSGEDLPGPDVPGLDITDQDDPVLADGVTGATLTDGSDDTAAAPGTDATVPAADGPVTDGDTDATDPGATDPGATDPGATGPGATDPGSDKGTSDPGTTEPGSDGGPKGSPGSDTGPGDSPGSGTTDPGTVEPVEFGFAGVPTTNQVGGGDNQEYLVSATFVGVSAGDQLRLTLSGPQAKFCGVDCDGDEGEALEVTVSAGDKLTVTFTAWLPGKSKTDLVASLNGSGTVSLPLR